MGGLQRIGLDGASRVPSEPLIHSFVGSRNPAPNKTMRPADGVAFDPALIYVALGPHHDAQPPLHDLVA